MNIVKMSILAKAICRFNEIPIKIPVAFFTDLGQIIINCVWNHKRPQTAKAVLRKKSKAGSIMLLDSNLYYKGKQPKQYSIVTKTDTQIKGTE